MTEQQDPYRPGRVMRVLGVVLPGVAAVQREVRPFAEYWHAANAAVDPASPRPLWVALGDSMTQGIGAPTPTDGWVGQLAARLAAAGDPCDVVNLSVSGARIRDVTGQQLPALHQLPRRPDMVTLLIGSNDLIGRRRRAHAVADYAALLDALPTADTDDTEVIAATLPPRNSTAAAINRCIDDAAARGLLRVADLRAAITWRTVRGTLATDHFHPNRLGYTRIADTFAAALDAAQTPH